MVERGLDVFHRRTSDGLVGTGRSSVETDETIEEEELKWQTIRSDR